MKKLILPIFLLISITGFAQKESNEKKAVNFYGSIFGLYEAKHSKFGGGLQLGVAPIKELGLGGGVQFFQLGGIPPGNKSGTDVFGEVRFFAPTKNIHPSIAFQIGTFIYNHEIASSNGGTGSTITIKGKQSIGGNINFCFSKRPDRRGFSLGYTYRSISLRTTLNTNTVTVLDGTVQAHIVTIGYNF